MKKLVFSLFALLMAVLLMNLTLTFKGNKADAIKLSSEIQIASADGQCRYFALFEDCCCDLGSGDYCILAGCTAGIICSTHIIVMELEP